MAEALFQDLLNLNLVDNLGSFQNTKLGDDSYQVTDFGKDSKSQMEDHLEVHLWVVNLKDTQA